MLRPGGRALVVIPRVEHLNELRRVVPLLRVDDDKRDRTLERLGGAFDLVDEREVAYQVELGPTDLGDLVGMTPSARHLHDGDLLRLGRLAGLTVRIGVFVLAFAPRATAP